MKQFWNDMKELFETLIAILIVVIWMGAIGVVPLAILLWGLRFIIGLF